MTTVAVFHGWVPLKRQSVSRVGITSRRAAWAHFRILYPTLLGPGAERFEAVARAVDTSLVVIDPHVQVGFVAESVGWCRGIGVREFRKNLSWKIATLPSRVLMAGLVGPHSGGNMVVCYPFQCFVRVQMSAMSTALWSLLWTQSHLAWDIVWLSEFDAEHLASFPIVDWASMCAML